MAQTFDIVTGGCGFIGSHLVDALLAQGRNVRVVDNGPQDRLAHHKGNPSLRIWDWDITRNIVLAFEDEPERIFHLAALSDIVPSIENPVRYYETNVTGTLNILEAARRTNCTKFIYTASSSCYGDKPPLIPTPEHSPINVKYPYALTKFMGECLVMHYSDVYGVPATSLRLFNVYGPRSRSNGVYGAMFSTFLAQLANDKPLTIVGDGEQRRDFTYVSDVVRALLLAAEDQVHGDIYNIGSGDSVSVNQIVRLLKAKNLVHIPERPGEPDITMANCKKARAQFHFSILISIEAGVKKMLAHLDEYKEAQVWTPQMIGGATEEWFRRLS